MARDSGEKISDHVADKSFHGSHGALDSSIPGSKLPAMSSNVRESEANRSPDSVKSSSGGLLMVSGGPGSTVDGCCVAHPAITRSGKTMHMLLVTIACLTVALSESFSFCAGGCGPSRLSVNLPNSTSLAPMILRCHF